MVQCGQSKSMAATAAMPLYVPVQCNAQLHSSMLLCFADCLPIGQMQYHLRCSASWAALCTNASTVLISPMLQGLLGSDALGWLLNQ